MTVFAHNEQNVLCVESVNCKDLAQQYGTPLYVYSRKAIESSWLDFANALQQYPHGSLICYAVKANSNLGVLSVLAKLGSGFDIVSAGELKRVLAAGGQAENTVFSGVGKSREEIVFALQQNIRCFNVESFAELQRLSEVAAELGVTAPVSIRINPDVDAKTHPYISTGLKENKFGIAMELASEVYQRAADDPHLEVHGIDCHIGSQLTDIEPYLDALDRLLVLVDQLAKQGIKLKHIDVGGGQGIRYKDETPLDVGAWVAAVSAKLQGRGMELMVEPGRVIVGNAGVLLTRIEYLKETADRNFLVVDAAMNDLIRPPLYDAWQDIIEVEKNQKDKKKDTYDVVGPICESTDFLGKNRSLSAGEGDLLAVKSCGAYCFVMSSNYNSRARAAEIMVDGSESHVVRQRESVDSLFELESVVS